MTKLEAFQKALKLSNEKNIDYIVHENKGEYKICTESTWYTIYLHESKVVEEYYTWAESQEVA